MDAEIEFPCGVGSGVTFQSQELSIQPRSRSMINTRKRSGCLIKEQIIYLSRKSVQHNPEMQYCWPRRARKTQGKRNSSSALVNKKNALLIQNVESDLGRQSEGAQVGLKWRDQTAAERGTAPSSESKHCRLQNSLRKKNFYPLSPAPPQARILNNNENINAIIRIIIIPLLSRCSNEWQTPRINGPECL